MSAEQKSRSLSPNDCGPWWAAAAGGGGGITAAVLQDHELAWAILAAFTAWLIHNVVIIWLFRKP
jgi:hypothetical protein